MKDDCLVALIDAKKATRESLQREQLLLEVIQVATPPVFALLPESSDRYHVSDSLALL